MKALKNGVIAISILLPGLLLAGETQTLRMKVERMACIECVEKLKAEISSLCKELSCDIKKGEAVCAYEAPVTAEEIVKRANKTGLRTTRLDESKNSR